MKKRLILYVGLFILVDWITSSIQVCIASRPCPSIINNMINYQIIWAGLPLFIGFVLLVELFVFLYKRLRNKK